MSTRKPKDFSGVTTIPCDEGCNVAEFTFKDGDDERRFCWPALADVLEDLIRHNDDLIFHMEDAPDGTRLIAVV